MKGVSVSAPDRGFRPATIVCKVCGVRITGRVDRRGRLFAARHPQNDAPDEPGYCVTHAPEGTGA